MRLDDFILKYVKRGGQIYNYINGWTWDEYRRLAELTELVDYQCHFDSKGVCKMYDAGGVFGAASHRSMCCCQSCARSMGYLSIIRPDVVTLGKYAESYDEKTGFWRKDGGCCLPRGLRSPICLRYSCVKSLGGTGLNESEKWLMAALGHRNNAMRPPKNPITDTKKFHCSDSFIIFMNRWLRAEKSSKKG